MVGSGAFQECSSITKVVVNEGLEDLSASCFLKCVSLADLQLSSTINFMSHSCFLGCVSLTKVVLPNNLRAVYDGVFRGCSNLSEINIPESVKLFGGSCLADCTSLKEIIIHDGVTTITASSFSGCSSLEVIRIPYFGTSPDNNLPFYTIFGSKIPTSLHTVIIGEACDNIPDNAFKNASNVKTVEFGANIKVIGNNSLTGLSALEKIVYRGTLDQFNVTSVHDTNAEILNKVQIEYK